MNQNKGFEILLDVKNICTPLGVDYWLNLGTILGLFRDKKFIDLPGEDIDIGLIYSNTVLELAVQLEIFKFNIQEERTLNDKYFHISANRDGIHVCFDVYHPYPKNLFYLYTETYVYYFFHPTNFLVYDNTINYNGTSFRAPDPIIPYLEFQYGPGWRTPLKKMVPAHLSHTSESCKVKEGAKL